MWLTLLFALGFAAIGSYALFSGSQRFLKVAHILRNDPRPVRDLDSYRGPVEIQGRAAAGEDGTITGPFTGTECLSYTYKLEERRTGVQGRHWETLDIGMGGVDFLVEDDTGRVAVDPTGAEVHFEPHTETVPAGTELPERLRAFVAADPDLEIPGRKADLSIDQVNVGNEQRLTERRIDVGEQVYVYGQARSGDTVEWGSGLVDALVADGEATPVFVISDTDERGTAWRIARNGLLKLVAGVGGLGIAVVIAATLLV